MKNHLLLLALLPALTFSHAKAQTVNPLFHHIPANADQVYHVNLSTLGPKVDWPTLSKVIKGRNLGNTKLPFNILSLMNAGCDFDGDLVIARANVDHADSVQYSTLIFHLTDSGKYVSFLRSNFNDLQFQHLAGHERAAVAGNTTYAWSDKLAVIIFVKRPGIDSVYPPAKHDMTSMAIAVLRGTPNSYFTTNNRFITTFSDDGDVQIWNKHAGNMGSLTKMIQGTPSTVPLNFFGQLAAKTTVGAAFGTLRFEPGKITYRSLRELDPKELSRLQHIAGQGLSNDLVSAAPPGRLMGLVGLHYDIAAIIDSMTAKIPADSLKKALGKKGLDLQDFVHAFKGDVLLLAYDPEKKPGGSPAKNPGIYVMLSLADPSAFSRIATGLKLGDARTAGNSTAPDTTHHGMFSWYAQQNGMAVIGGDPQRVNAFFEHPAAGANPAEHLLLPRSRPDIFHLGIDLNTTADFLTPILMKGDTIPAKNQTLLDALRSMDVLLLSSGGTRDGAMESDLELHMTDKNKNGLASFLDIIGKLSAKPSGNAEQ